MRRITEPIRKSLLDIVQENLRAAGRGSHITRIAYFGEYEGTPDDLREHVEEIVNDLQKDFSDIQISGLLLVYPRFYIHVFEALEDIIYKHFKRFYESSNENVILGKSVILPTYHHVHQRFFAKWYSVYTTPPSLLEKPESTSFEEMQKQVCNCILKIYGLCNFMLSTGFNNASAMHAILENLGERTTRLLPESTLIEYLLGLDSPILRSIDDYVRVHAHVPYIHLYNDSIWPPPRDTMLSGVRDKRRNVDCQPSHQQDDTNNHPQLCKLTKR